MINRENVKKVLDKSNLAAWYEEPLMEDVMLKALEECFRAGFINHPITKNESQILRYIARNFYTLGLLRGIQTERGKRRREVERESYTVTARKLRRRKSHAI